MFLINFCSFRDINGSHVRCLWSDLHVTVSINVKVAFFDENRLTGVAKF